MGVKAFTKEQVDFIDKYVQNKKEFKSNIKKRFVTSLCATSVAALLLGVAYFIFLSTPLLMMLYLIFPVCLGGCGIVSGVNALENHFNNKDAMEKLNLSKLDVKNLEKQLNEGNLHFALDSIKENKEAVQIISTDVLKREIDKFGEKVNVEEVRNLLNVLIEENKERLNRQFKNHRCGVEYDYSIGETSQTKHLR